MTYPDSEGVELADHKQLTNWYKNLPTPGERLMGEEGHQELLLKESAIINRIATRIYKEFNGLATDA